MSQCVVWESFVRELCDCCVNVVQGILECELCVDPFCLSGFLSVCVGVSAGVVCVFALMCVWCVATHKHALRQEMRRRAFYAWPLCMYRNSIKIITAISIARKTSKHNRHSNSPEHAR